MGVPGLLGLAAWSFYVLVLAVQPHQAHSSIRGSFGLNKGAVASPENGICASSVTVHGYKCEEHEVTTKDGYIVSVQRIPEGRDGLTWLLNSPEQNLPLILADNGFDVWISNTRGTRLSRRHVSFVPSQLAFWNWSWDELVSFELPALFDYVYGQTGQKIDYVGHSLGTLTALASFSEGKLVNQLKSAALLSPVAYLSHMKTALGVVAAKSFVGEIGRLLGLAEFNPKGEAGGDFLKILCDNPGVGCSDLVTAITGTNSCNGTKFVFNQGKNCCLNSSTVDLFLMTEPQPTSIMNMVHLSQTVRNGVVAKYNYGRLDNFMHYGEAMPPIYNLSNIPHDLPMFLSYGGQDALSDVLDVKHLLDDLKSHDVDKLSVQFIKDYAHADFIMGVNAKDVVYNQVIKFFKGQH
ncbi:triacylglycerol lipase 2 [Quercus suber]|uniref:Lipase n=1 Tax=Quercus suber TaxID=58331 RepID=A0AAW0JE97_QUESU